MYAALVEELPADERARVDEELRLPLGVTADSVERARKEWMAAQGWA